MLASKHSARRTPKPSGGFSRTTAFLLPSLSASWRSSWTPLSLARKLCKRPAAAYLTFPTL